MAAKNAIPTIDLSPLRGASGTERREVARQIDAACTEIGFFIVTGHGISQDLITTARQQAIDFFALPDEEKMKVQRPPAKISRGYNWVGDRSVAYSMGQAAPPDIQEAFAFGPESVADLASRVDAASAKMYAPNIWPERPADFKKIMLSCRVGGGALDCSRADLRPPHKLDVQFSRIQLSRRRCPLSSDGRDQRDKIDKPELAVELAGWQRCPTAAAPFPEPVRPDSSHQPAVESVEELSDVGPLVVMAPTTHNGVRLFYQLLSGHRSVAPREPANLILEVADRFLPRVRIQRSRLGTSLDLARRQPHGPAASLDLVPEELEAIPDV